MRSTKQYFCKMEICFKVENRCNICIYVYQRFSKWHSRTTQFLLKFYYSSCTLHAQFKRTLTLVHTYITKKKNSSSFVHCFNTPAAQAKFPPVQPVLFIFHKTGCFLITHIYHPVYNVGVSTFSRGGWNFRV